jgi:hypothetical protein
MEPGLRAGFQSARLTFRTRIQQTRPEAGFHLAGHFSIPFPPPVSDRLAELQRQRALAQEQLAWFDREIAKETGQAPAPPVPVPAVVAPVPVVAPITPVTDAATAQVADEIIARYEKSPQNAAKDAKKGCYLWFIFGLGMLAICAVSIYLIYTYLR